MHSYERKSINRRQILYFAAASILLSACGSPSQPGLHQYARSGDTNGIAELLSRGANVNERDTSGSPALYVAVHWEGNTLGTAIALLDAGANPNASNIYGESAIFSPCVPGSAQLLISKGAIVKAKNTALLTPLHAAILNCRNLSSDSLEALVSAGASIGATSSGGFTPLHFAAATGSLQSLRWLLVNGANPNAENAQGLTPLDLAQAGGYSQASLDIKAKGGKANRYLAQIFGNATFDKTKQKAGFFSHFDYSFPYAIQGGLGSGLDLRTYLHLVGPVFLEPEHRYEPETNLPVTSVAALRSVRAIIKDRNSSTTIGTLGIYNY